MNIVIPTYKRADALVGRDYFSSARYVLPKSQEEEYAKVLSPERMIVIDDEHDGNVARKRNWILGNIERPLLMIDDDVKCLMMSEGVYDESGNFLKVERQRVLSPEQALSVIEGGFNLANEWGCKLWGLNVNTDGRNYQQYKPFSLTQMVLGPFQGHLEHDLKFDERMGTKEDYDMSLQQLKKYKMVLRMNKYAYYCEHGDNEGGIVSYRTMEKETQWCRAIEKKWGRRVIRYPMEPKKYADLLNATVNVPIGGV